MFLYISFILFNIICFLITSIIWFLSIVKLSCICYVSSHYHRLQLPRADVHHLPSQHQLISFASPISSISALLLLFINFIFTCCLLSINCLLFLLFLPHLRLLLVIISIWTLFSEPSFNFITINPIISIIILFFFLFRQHLSTFYHMLQFNVIIKDLYFTGLSFFPLLSTSSSCVSCTCTPLDQHHQLWPLIIIIYPMLIYLISIIIFLFPYRLSYSHYLKFFSLSKICVYPFLSLQHLSLYLFPFIIISTNSFQHSLSSF